MNGLVLATVVCNPKAALYGLCTLINQHDPTHFFGPIVEVLVEPILVFIILYTLGRIFRRMVVRAVEQAHGDQHVRSLVHNVISIATYCTAVLSAAVSAGLNLNILLTFGGLTSLAIGLAFQNMLQNIISGFFILLERPFKLGDTITLTSAVTTVVGVTGTVTAVTLRTTTLRMSDGEFAIVPNLIVFSNLVINLSKYDKRQQSFAYRVPTADDVRPAVNHIRLTLAGMKGIETKPPLSVHPEPHPDGGFLIKCSYWVNRKKHDLDLMTNTVANALWVDADASIQPADDAVISD